MKFLGLMSMLMATSAGRRQRSTSMDDKRSEEGYNSDGENSDSAHHSGIDENEFASKNNYFG